MKCPECGCKDLSSIIVCDQCNKEEKFDYMIDTEYPPNHWFAYKKHYFDDIKHFCGVKCFKKWKNINEVKKIGD